MVLKNNILKGVFLVGLGGTSYGMLATFVKLAYAEGYSTSEVTISQFAYGIIGMLIIIFLKNNKHQNNVKKASSRNILQLVITGTSLGFTSIFYYLTIKYIPVSIAIVLLMQTVWMGVFLEMILEKKLPSVQKIIAVIVILIGTILATNLIESKTTIDWRGIALGLLSAASFTTTMFASNKIATHISSAQRSLYMLLGGAIIVLCFAIATENDNFNFEIFLKWGIIVSLFGTIIPPLLFNSGFPYTGIGLGSIVASLELPISVMMAYCILNENVTQLQWLGILLIILSVVIMNINIKKRNLKLLL